MWISADSYQHGSTILGGPGAALAWISVDMHKLWQVDVTMKDVSFTTPNIAIPCESDLELQILNYYNVYNVSLSIYNYVGLYIIILWSNVAFPVFFQHRFALQRHWFGHADLCQGAGGSRIARRMGEYGMLMECLASYRYGSYGLRWHHLAPSNTKHQVNQVEKGVHGVHLSYRHSSII